ncbi:unnamed protein product [Rotaria socialis]|uniref:Uncharacterized protein n=1 Tax=Rotaria socialis TaxID=392032 RepID=A0A818FX10_9BILA|nr:unnamed protein product [Rotaria socialis]CAF3480588.1 unnamed protein product [Rotaria socialis]CAF3525196.1 unnamed protein product [Rotaria socialis]
MAIDIYCVLFLTIFIITIKCDSDVNVALNNDNQHLHESSSYKYSKQGNLQQFIIMNIFSSFNNIFLMIISITLIPIIIIFFLISITTRRLHQSLLTIYLSFASGGLMADVFLRLLPSIILAYNDSFDTKSQSEVYHQHDNRAGLFILAGIFLSFIIEKVFQYLQSYNHEIYNESSTMNSTEILAYLFLLADILHNYTNSVTLCSIISMKSTINSAMLITKIIYELLHVFYGYNILIYSGKTLEKAMQYQLLTGLSGSILFLATLKFQSYLIVQLWSNQILLPIIAGIFIYISTVHLIPEVIGSDYGMKKTILKVNAFIVSVLCILYLKKYE